MRVSTFRFRKRMTIGDPSAEHDAFLENAFVDTGDVGTLLDLTKQHCVIVGRTGAGKSALLRTLQERHPHRLIKLDPQSLSLQYLEGSTVIPVLTSMGVRLNFFWSLFWRHIIALELIQQHYHIHSKEEQKSFLSRVLMRHNRKDEKREAALNYLQDWAGEFWKDSDTRTKKLFDTLETKVESATEGALGPVKAKVGAVGRSEHKVESDVVMRVQEAVNRVQFQHLAEVLEILKEEALHDPHKPYFVLIDDLDRDWIEATYAYDMIDALMDEAGQMRRLGNIKVVIALRENILNQVNARLSGKRGRQREKSEGLLLRLKWTRSDLTLLLDKRLHELMRGQYGEKASMKAILPSEPHRGRNTGPAVDYMLNRTIQRPRDLIKFFNYCIDAAEGRGKVEWQHIFKAEGKYSKGQFTSLVDEWSENYPDIEFVMESFREITSPFLIEAFSDRAYQLIEAGEHEEREGSLTRAMQQFFEAGLDPLEAARRIAFPKLYEMCFIGVKVSPQDPLRYYYDDPDLLAGTVPDGARVYVHPALHLALNVK
jgi:hypothetical protein